MAVRRKKPPVDAGDTNARSDAPGQRKRTATKAPEPKAPEAVQPNPVAAPSELRHREIGGHQQQPVPSPESKAPRKGSGELAREEADLRKAQREAHYERAVKHASENGLPKPPRPDSAPEVDAQALTLTIPSDGSKFQLSVEDAHAVKRQLDVLTNLPH